MNPETLLSEGAPETLGWERGTLKELDALGLHKMLTTESFRFL